MSDALNLVSKAIDEQYADEPANTRRQFVKGAAATLGGLGVLGAFPAAASAHAAPARSPSRLGSRVV